MARLNLHIELEYDADLMHSGDNDKEAKAWFLREILSDDGSLVLHSNEVGDSLGTVKVLSVEIGGVDG